MGCVSKYGLFIINSCVIFLGVTVVGVSAAILQQDSIFGVLLTQVFYSVPLSALIGGLFVTFLGVLGCWGAAKEDTCALKTYASIVGVLMVMVVTAGVLLMVFTTGSTAYIISSMKVIFNEYGGADEDLTYDLDFLQHNTHCCGIQGYEDWADFIYGNSTNVADGCCKNQTEGCGVGLLQDPQVKELVYTAGCLSFLTDALSGFCIALGVVTLVLASIQMLSISWACIIIRDSSRSSLLTTASPLLDDHSMTTPNVGLEQVATVATAVKN
nr:CD63 antigen-like isoform X1 [Procambarus clarkii]